MSERADLDTNPAAHYDRVTAAWRLLLGEELHYGVFLTGQEDLASATAALTDRMLAAAQLRPGLDLLDVGCGTGAPACRLAGEFRIKVLGITTSQVGVDAACERSASSGLSDVARFEVRDGTDNGLSEESFDRVWVLESSHLMPDREALIRECARVLRPGGRMVLCDIVRRREIPFREVMARRADLFILRDAFGDARMEPLELYADLAVRHGLTVERADDLTAATLPTFDRWRRNVARHRDEATSVLGVAGVRAFERSTEILENFWLDGTFGYGLLAASKPAP